MTSEQIWKPCPSCRTEGPTKVNFTWWGGLLGAKVGNVVKCTGCGSQYNGRTGGPLTAMIVTWLLVGGVIGFVIGFFLFFNN